MQEMKLIDAVALKEKWLCSDHKGMFVDFIDNAPEVPAVPLEVHERMKRELNEEKQALIAGQETLQKALAEKNEEIKNRIQNFKVLCSDHRTLQQSFDNLKSLYEEEKAKVEKAKEKCAYFAKEVQKARAETDRVTAIGAKWKEAAYTYADNIDRIKSEAIKEFMDSAIERVEKARQKYQRLCKEQGEEIDEAMNIHFNGMVNILKETVGEG